MFSILDFWFVATSFQNSPYGGCIRWSETVQKLKSGIDFVWDGIGLARMFPSYKVLRLEDLSDLDLHPELVHWDNGGESSVSYEQLETLKALFKWPLPGFKTRLLLRYGRRDRGFETERFTPLQKVKWGTLQSLVRSDVVQISEVSITLGYSNVLTEL